MGPPQQLLHGAPFPEAASAEARTLTVNDSNISFVAALPRDLTLRIGWKSPF
jgi:hypothetical protein